MKRITIAILLSIVAMAMFAQEMVEIGNGTEQTFSPIFPYYNYTVSQQIYLQSELEEQGFTSGQITHIAFQSGSSIDMENSQDWAIYIGETANTAFAYEGWIPLSEQVEVFDGAIGVDFLNDGIWLTITLSDPFVYTGTANLVITVMEYTPGNSGWGTRFWGTASHTNCCIFTYNDGEAYTPKGQNEWGTGSLGSNRPNTQITYLTVSEGTDLSIAGFAGPTLIPSTTGIQVTVYNLGDDPVDGDGYSIDFYEGDENGTLLYTITTTQALQGGSFDNQTHIIPHTVVNNWAFASQQAGPATITAVLSCPADINSLNNTKTLATHLRPSYDIQVVSFTGMGMLPTAHPITITLQNNGRASIVAESYSIEIFENEQTTPLFVIGNEAALQIGKGLSQTFTIPSAVINQAAFTTASGDLTLNLLVISLTEAEETTENNTATITASIFDGSFSTETIAEVGTTSSETSYEIPFAINYHDNISQSIYTADELGEVASGVITHINYKVTIATEILLTSPYLVSIYMANYDAPNGFANADDWVAGSAFTRVAHNVALPFTELGTYHFWLPLEVPFMYNGGDLVVMTYKDHDFYTSSLNFFFQTPDQANYVTLHKQRDAYGTPFDPADPTIGGYGGSLKNFKPQMRFAFTFNGYGVVAGVITDETSTPLPDVTVALQGTDRTFTTTGDGHYSFGLNVSTNALLTFTAFGYLPQEIAVNELAWSGGSGLQEAVHNVTMLSAAQATVTGSVVFGDSGLPVEGLNVNIGTLTAETDSNGQYSISGVFFNTDYLVSVPMTTFIGYFDYTEVINLSADLVENGVYILDISITENMRPPLYVTADLTSTGSRVINWYKPAQETTVTQDLGAGNYYGYGSVGSGEYYIAAHRYTAQMLAELGVVGSTLAKVSFMPATATGDYSIIIFTGADLANPDVETPTLLQPITTDLVALQFNEVLLHTPILLSEGELVIGVLSTGAQMRVHAQTPLDNNDGYGNKYYYNGEWTTMLTVSSGWPEHWCIKGVALTFHQSVERGFTQRYSVYRDGTLLTAMSIIGEDIRTSFEDTTPLLTGTYQYAVTAIYSGDLYPENPQGNNWVESEPALSNEIDYNPLVETDLIKPGTTALKGNYPNPFNPSTTIAFSVANKGRVCIDVFNLKGQRVKTLVNNEYTAGSHIVVWNGVADNGKPVGSGVYFYRMTAGGYTSTQKMLLLK